ncbi:xanthine dehydrogenase family protein molybdopterin-binding subunit [Alicyclobacillus fastidiosus]|uniref:Xanthine dehydrogenase family protein molybdopterin-binding subunit n=1 Tax=Alicyclobacillus fastidiosus TaxID=392011 RepID=A0ABV5AES2_9BACL|nr:xanthine dehydrogenase family protein molybdopterin-binding subunit [Alicyclobacillus fastidiosus]WEH09489.1 xanthine dehydrogenase family protein molybdopterin-binding subunit [Alicyclobacillus fastidiosus]
MADTKAIGRSIPRKDAAEKVGGFGRYTDDFHHPDMLHAVLVISPYAHARLLSVDTSKALAVLGVRAVVTGQDCRRMTGSPLEDRPVLAFGRVRYAGEPVAIVVAEQLHQAEAAAALVEIHCEPLPVVQSPRESFSDSAPRIHPELGTYHYGEQVRPIPGSNIATYIRVHKGEPQAMWSGCAAVVECDISFPQAHHAPMETHCTIAEIFPGGKVHLMTATQSPYSVPEIIEATFGYRASDVRVSTPLVGGGFGGKSSVFIEPLAVAASEAVGGRRVKLRCSREQDMLTLPGHIGLEANIKLGATRDGRLVAAEITYWFDGGGYSDRGVIVTLAAAQDCTGPYRVDHLHCDAYCMYTNHPPTTSFRGFGHPEQTFVIERALDELALKLDLDPLELRQHNAILPGDTTPTQARLTRSSIGDVPGCFTRLQELLDWRGPVVKTRGSNLVAKGIAGVWKTSSTPPDASSGAVVYVHRDGRVTLLTGLVEIGQGTKTALTQMVAEVFQMSAAYVDVVFEVNTTEQPEHWKTVASRGSLLAGNAAVRAAEDAVAQLARNAALAMGCRPEDVQIRDGMAVSSHAQRAIPIGALSHGFTFPDGHVVGSYVVGRGTYTIEGVIPIDFDTGQGVPGPEWTVAAQGVEVEYNPRDFTYRVTRAVTVVDCGKVIHPQLALGQIKGGMSMGLSLASREGYVYRTDGVIANPQFRVYPIHRYGDHPAYEVDFLETPHRQAPWGLRGLGEHGLIGMPAALANALSNATGGAVNHMPMTSELLWRLRGGGMSHDPSGL